MSRRSSLPALTLAALALCVVRCRAPDAVAPSPETQDPQEARESQDTPRGEQAPGTPEAPEEPSASDEQRPAEAGPAQLTVVYSVNNSGYVGVCGCEHKELRQGSLKRRASYLRQLRSTGRALLLVDGGSSLFPVGDRVKEEEKTKAVRTAELIVEAFNRMGYQAMAVGAFDIAAGIDELKRLEKRAKFKILSANLFERSTGKRYFPASTVVEAGGLRVGIIGLTISTLTRPYLMKVAPKAQLRDPIQSARQALEEMGDDVDLVIALSHLREETNFELVKELKGIGILVDPYVQYGNHRTWIKEHEWLSFKENTLFLRSDGQGARLGVVDVSMATPRERLFSGDRLDELRERVDSNRASEEEQAELRDLEGKNLYRFARVSLEPHLLDDPEMDHLIAQWEKGMDPAEVKPLGEEFPKRKEFVTHVACEGCHEKQYAFWMNTAHFHALDTLREIGEERRHDCIGCHTLGYGLAFLDAEKTDEYGSVQCESCHGTNPTHVDEPQKHRFARVPRRTCIICHNKEVTNNDFDFARSRAKVACPKG